MIWLFSFLIGAFSHGDIGTTYGVGSVTAGLAGANRIGSEDGFSLTRNIASMSLYGKTFTTGVLGAVDFFKDAPSVVVDNTEIGTSQLVADVETDVSDSMIFLLGATWEVNQSDSKPRLGLVLGAPIDKLMEPSTRDLYLPAYSMYRTDSQRLFVTGGGSARIGENFILGMGFNYYLTQAATLQGRLLSGGKTSTMNLQMLIKPVLAPLLGVIWEFNEHHRLGLNYAGDRNSRLNMKVDNTVDVGGTGLLAFTSASTLYYDPEVWSLGYSGVFGSSTLDVSADLERWEKYDGGSIDLDFQTFQGTFTQTKVEQNFKNIVVPRIGFTAKSDLNSYRVGYAFRPTPFPDPNTSKTNHMDSDRHILGLGYGRTVNGLFWTEGNGTIDVHYQTQYLNPKSVVKSSATDIGAPGYDIGGFVFSYGVTVTLGI